MANVVGFLRKAFPFISAAAALGGPPAVMVANLVGKALNIDTPDATGDAIAQAMANATPEQVIALKEVEQQVQQQMLQFGFKTVDDLLTLDTQDRSNARTMQEQTRSWMPNIIAGVFIVGFFLALYFMARGMVNDAAHDVVITMIGVLGGGVKDILGYFFGSSAGSAAKTDILAKLSQN